MTCSVFENDRFGRRFNFSLAVLEFHKTAENGKNRFETFENDEKFW